MSNQEKNKRPQDENIPEENEYDLSGFTNDDSLPGTTHLNDEMPEMDEDSMTRLEEQLKACNDKYLRLVAEFDNFRKRNTKERIDLINNASEDIIKSLLDVLDDSDRAMQQIEASNDVVQIKEGIALVFTKLRNILGQKGLKEMQSKGSEFNPDRHEAIAEIPAGAEDNVGKVMDEVSKGYLLNDKIIRHAKVVVGK